MGVGAMGDGAMEGPQPAKLAREGEEVVLQEEEEGIVELELDEEEAEQPKEEEELVQLDSLPRKEGKKKVLRARFGRRRTHNEQLIVRPCGIIVARGTFYGAEVLGSVVVSLSC
ncbi:hypothetical protein CALVIDRAFT_521789 [Calocera viscosa TUFC12733]|uniref:Uncharacterized protein n=1 Tax=Calocera viscosa (strain TUFC12733) TaxID=1330018 RepID=A0A167H755_CALVF|nr:hypothetical protein CALVIDRAFT_521789 [Calocera viscosa TUFC12733]